jgi:hypothetical protein
VYFGDIYAHLKIPIFCNPKQIRKKKNDCPTYQ